MRKLVNGKVINIDNIELFELAAEGLALQNTTTSGTSDGIEANINSPLVSKFIKQYDIFFKAMPYPLYAIESDIKYATLGNFIKSLSKEPIQIWVDKGLHIKLDKNTGMTLRIVNNTWSIVYTKENRSDNTSLDLFRSCIGYKEYLWILNKITKKETTANFYIEFMPEFVKACNGQAMILKWELENMLTFGTIPNKLELKPNKILSISNNKEYSLDIFCNGYVNSDEKVYTWNLSSNNKALSESRYKQVKTYGYDLYSKYISDSIKESKIEKCSLTGIQNLFLELCGIKSACDMISFPNFEGIISDTNLVFTIDKRLYISKSNRLATNKDIAHGVDIYTVEGNKVYFTKPKRITDKISKESLYSYNITDGTLRLCKVIFTY